MSINIKTVLITIILIFSNFSHSQVWVQKGIDLNGEASGDESGGSVDINSNGTKIAIGAPGNDGNGSASGQVRIYFWNGATWVQQGQDINGETTGDYSGYSVSLNADGNIVAIGAPLNNGSGLESGHVRVFQWNGSIWIQKGLDINGESPNDSFGSSVSISTDGNTLAIGAIGNDGSGSDAGHVRVLQWNGISWVPKGIDIDGEFAGDISGGSVSLSSDGNIIAIGAIGNDGSGSDAGHARIFEWSGAVWIQKGIDINGEATGDYLGASVSVSADGNIVAIGATLNDVAGFNAGQVSVYQWSGSAWIQKGQDINGQFTDDYSGESVSLSSDGNIIAIGAGGNDGLGNDNGNVRIFQWNGSVWLENGTDINGEAIYDYSGEHINLSSDGNIIAIGARYNDGSGNNAGHVRVYQQCNNNLTTVQQSTCDTYNWTNGISYNSTGIYSQTLINSLGCDSIITLNLTILNSSTGTDFVTSCDSYTWIDGNNYSINNNTATYILSNSVGCDSIVTLDLTITLNAFTFFDTICGGPYYWNGISYPSSGSYNQTFVDYLGCDSVVTLNLIVHANNFNPTFFSNQQLFTSPPFAVQFSNTTVNPGNYNFTWYWGDGTSMTSNNPTVFHQYLNNGLFSVTLEATNILTGCSDDTTFIDYIFTTGGVACTHTANINESGPITACSGQSVILTCNSSPTFTYQWRKNGIYVSGNNNDTLIVTQPGTYSVIITENGCPVSSSEIVVNFSTITTPVITSVGIIQPCIGGSVTLNATPGFTSYLWSNGNTTPTTNVTVSGNYTVQVTNSSGCSSTSNAFTINASILPIQNLCIIGVDSASNNLRVVWEKPISIAIDSFYIYKESNVSNIYTKVGARHYDSLSVWIDPISNPAVQAYRYKITALDTCGTETPLSDFHKSIHLTINQGVGGTWNLIWSHYEGLIFGSYNIYRGSDPLNMSLLTTIQSNLNSYTDLTPPVGPVYYQIEIVNPNNCDPTKVINYNVSKSNIVNNGVSSTAENIKDFKVFPNPTDNILYIQSTDFLDNTIIIFDAQGRKVLAGKLTGTTTIIDISKLAAGNYLVQIGEKQMPVRIVKN